MQTKRFYPNRKVHIFHGGKHIGAFDTMFAANFFIQNTRTRKQANTKKRIMDFFGLNAKRENEALKKAIEHEPRAQYNYSLIMSANNAVRFAASVIAACLFWTIIRGC